MSAKKKVPDVLLVIKPVDGGRACIGMMECPNCGQSHFTTWLQTGERKVFCGKVQGEDIAADGYSQVNVVALI